MAETEDLRQDVTSQSPPDARTFKYAGAAELLALHDWYQPIHGYLATMVCIYGIIANTVNIIVLTRPNMITATNCILTGLAVSDGLTMAAYLPFVLHLYIVYGLEVSPERNNYAAMSYVRFYAGFSIFVHSVSIWLTVVLAIFRYMLIEYPQPSVIWCNIPRAKLTIVIVYVVMVLVCIPNFVSLTLASKTFAAQSISSWNATAASFTDATSTSQPEVIWFVTFKLDTEWDQFVHQFNFWIQALFVKLLACCGLTILSALLINALQAAEKRRQQLRGREGRVDRRGRANARTTRMLLVVVILFLVTEVPQGVLNLLGGIFDGFVDEIYLKLGDVLDILALTNNGINFLLYCTMSKQFRDTFCQIFIKRKCTTAQSSMMLSTTGVVSTAIPLR